MSLVRRVFVEKKPGFDVSAQALAQDFLENLNVPGLTGVRLLHRYDVQGLSEEAFTASLPAVFSEPAVDMYYLDKFPRDTNDCCFAVEYLPGQYDQRADSAAQCVQLHAGGARPDVRTARVYVLSGTLPAESLERIQAYVINPVDSRLADMDKPDSLDMQLSPPEKVPVVQGFCELDIEGMERLRVQLGLAMSVADLASMQEYYKAQAHRDPTLTEVRVLDTYWSDHCRHTTFLTRLEFIEFDQSEMAQRVRHTYEEYLSARSASGRLRDVCLMDVATAYVRQAKKDLVARGLDESEEINACTIRCKANFDGTLQDYLILFKNETHNHPTEIEPFGGAATCLGGAIRDPLSGRAYVYQAMRVTGAGDPRQSVAETLPFKLPQRKIVREAAAGYSSYGNQIGLATGSVREYYHPGYLAKRLEIGAVVGAAPQENVVRLCPQPGDVILLIGGRTGRDGCGGATGSSKAHDESSITACGAEVQKGNPLTERKLQRLFRNPEFSQKVIRCNDFGAGGVSVAVGELAPSLDINLDAVLKKYEGLNGTELAISESQERMAVVVRAQDEAAMLSLAAAENLEAVRIASVTDTGRMVARWRGDTIVDLQRDFLDSNGATQRASVLVKGGQGGDLLAEPVGDSLETTLLSLLGDLNLCSQKGLIERFDSSIGAGSVLLPFGGKYQGTPTQAMAALLPTLGAVPCSTATLMAAGFDPILTDASPYVGAVYAVVSSVAKLVAAGGKAADAWLTLQEYFQKLGKDPLRWGKPLAALLGAYAAQRGLSIAAIGGKDSMSGSFKELSVPSTLVSFALCPTDACDILSGEFKKSDSDLWLVDFERDELQLPVWADVRRKFALVARVNQEKCVRAAYAVERGGVLVAIANMAFGNRIGACLDWDVDMAELTAKRYGAIVLEVPCGTPVPAGARRIGCTSGEYKLRFAGQAVDLAAAYAAYEAPLESVFPTKTKPQGACANQPLYTARSAARPAARIARPRVVIPVFPGTNCEYDSARVFARAGAAPVPVIIRNLSPQAIEESVAQLEAAIRNGQIVMLPGGFSGGDEPDGSGKFIATTFRNPRIMDAVQDLLHNRDGLMLGICNGFQALVKLGLVPYGDIREMRQDSPTLTFNTLGRHASTVVRTRVTSCLSPWLMECEAGDIHSVAVSHGEGRFVASPQEIDDLFAKGQVAFQYVEDVGAPSLEIPHNPNGSLAAIEGITSPDGRVLGKMGHSERYAPGLLRNICGEKDQKIFASGVKYFL